MDVVMNVVVCVAAFGICLAALVILLDVDLRRGGRLLGMAWAVVAACSAWVGVMVAEGVLPMPMPLQVMVVGMALLVWLNLDAVACRASCTHARQTRSRTRVVKFSERGAAEDASRV